MSLLGIRTRDRVLLVDDDEKFRSLCQLGLIHHYEVDVAASGAVALTMLSGVEDYAVVVSDLEMPDWQK